MYTSPSVSGGQKTWRTGHEPLLDTITGWAESRKAERTCGLWLSEQLAAVPEFHGLGPLFKSSPEPVALTESETEYVIRCTKHTFAEHMVFQVRPRRGMGPGLAPQPRLL